MTIPKLIKGPLSSRPVDAPVGTLFWDEDTNITYVYDDAAWSVYPGSGRGNWATKAELAAAKALLEAADTAILARLAQLEQAVLVTVVFDTDGGSQAPASQSVVYNTTATEPDDPTKEGKYFAGWFLPEATEAFVFTTPIIKNCELTAHWSDEPVMASAPKRASRSK